MDACKAMLKSMICMKSDKYRLKCKQFHSMKDFRIFMDEYLPTVKQDIDGLVFTPVNDPIRIRTHETMFKWKDLEKTHRDIHVTLEPTRETQGATAGHRTG